MLTLTCLFMGFLFISQLLCTMVYKTVKMECLPNAAYIRNSTCKLKPINWQISTSNMDCDIVNKIRNASLHLQIFTRNTANQYKPFLINVTNNLCDILDRRNFPAYTTIVMKILKDVSNVNHSCPFTGHLRVKNLHLDKKYLPITPPLGLYKIVFRFLEGYPYADLGTVILYIEVDDIQNIKPRRHNNARNKSDLAKGRKISAKYT